MAREKIYLFDHSPHLRDEWDDENNVAIDPESLTIHSNKKVWWLCHRGHRWEAIVGNRTKGKGCPWCSGRKTLPCNSIEATDPHLLIFWDYSLNKVKPSDVGRGSMSKVWWKCENSHTWTAAIYSLAGGSRCPYCSGRKPIVGVNDLATLYPDISRELINPTDSYLLPQSNKIVEWICSNGHKWATSPSSRVGKNTGCPYCSGNRVLVGFNDLATLHPKLVNELVDDVDTSKISEQSHRKLTWKCSENHTWITRVSHRVNGSGCPKCCLNQTSKIESRFRDALSSLYVTSGPHKLPVPFRKNTCMTVDSYIDKPLPAVFEYDGQYFHQSESSFSRDKDKTTALLNNGYLVIRVRENSLDNLEIDNSNLLQLSVPYSTTDEHLLEAIEKIKEWIDEKTKDDRLL